MGMRRLFSDAIMISLLLPYPHKIIADRFQVLFDGHIPAHVYQLMAHIADEGAELAAFAGSQAVYLFYDVDRGISVLVAHVGHEVFKACGQLIVCGDGGVFVPDDACAEVIVCRATLFNKVERDVEGFQLVVEPFR